MSRNGSWLCEGGPYQDHITALCPLYPGLCSEDPKNHCYPVRHRQARVTILEVQQGRPVVRRDYGDHDAQNLRHYLEHQRAKSSYNNVCIVEGLARDYIDVVGSYFNINPTIFMNHERTVVFTSAPTGVSDSLELPSLLDPNKTFQLKYYEIRHFELDKISSWDYAAECAETCRHIGITKTRPHYNHKKSGISPVGIVRRKCAFWSRNNSNGSWDGTSDAVSYIVY